jgi:C_GCAxxG_C_C family probable redox protein
MELKEKNIKKVFRQKGACSHTTFFLLNEEFGNSKPNEEHASDPFGGGVVQQGHQCGLIWGAAMAAGTEAYKQYKNTGKAIEVSIKATQIIMESFKERTGVHNCREFTKSDFTKPLGLVKYLITGKAFACFNLAQNWLPEAYEAAKKGLQTNNEEISYEAVSCASEVIKKMGGTEEEQMIVSGFAGGLGLSGKGCGAFSAAVWKTILELVKKGEWKYTLKDKDSKEVMNRFLNETEGKMTCEEITGCKFNSLEEHSEFIQKGGCEKLINVLANITDK